MPLSMRSPSLTPAPSFGILPRPLLKVVDVGSQKASLSWNLDESGDPSLVKSYRIILNSKLIENLSPSQHDYELRNLKPGTKNDIQVSVISHRNDVDEKISEPIRIVCPKRPQPPVIQSIQTEKPFSIRIKWKIDNDDEDEITSFKIFLDGKLHGKIETNRLQSFKYDFDKLQAEKTYGISIKSLIEQKKLDIYVYQCEIESDASNQLLLKCSTPRKGPTPRIVSMDSNGIDIVWDKPAEDGDTKIIGYQMLKNGRAIGKLLPIDEGRASINDLEIGNRYTLQILPITDQPGDTLLQTGEEYDPERPGHYLPGPKLEVEYTDLVQLPTKIWIENISGHSAMVCWSSIDESLSSNIQPDNYKLLIWNKKDKAHDKHNPVTLTKDENSTQLKDLQSDTTYEIQLEAYKKRRHQTTNELYTVSATSEILTFKTGSPPEAPSNLYLIACTNTAVRIGFDRFIEHNSKIITLRVQCESTSSSINTKNISMDLKPDSTEFILSDLIKHTNYNVTLYGITDEYLNENHCHDVSQLPKKFKSSNWLPNKSLQFTTSGCERASKIQILQATTESIQLDWTLPKAYGSTEYLGQILRWKLEHSDKEDSMELDCNVTNATIPGILPSGLYKISLDSLFNIKINLEDDNDKSSRKELRLTKSEKVLVRLRIPTACEQPEIYLTGYTTKTIDLKWNKPNMFNIIDHPEKINEQIKIYRRLIEYRIDINEHKYKTLDQNQYQYTLTECQLGEEYQIQLVAKTIIRNEYMNNMIINNKEDIEKPDETPSKKLRIRMLKADDLLRSFQANFQFNYNILNENITKQKIAMKSLGKINVNWTVSNTKNISHFILQWYSTKYLRIQQKILPSNDTSYTIDECDEKHLYVIEIIIITNDNNRYQYEQIKIPIPGEPDPPKIWLAKQSDTDFIVQWSEPKSYGIPIIGFQLFIDGKKKGDIIEVNQYREKILSRINRIYRVRICAITNNPQRPRSIMSQPLLVITTNLIPIINSTNDDGNLTSFDRNITHIIQLQIESISEEKLYLDWTSFLPIKAIRAYYIHYTCLNNGEVQTMKVSKRHRQTVLRGLRPGFTYKIMVIAVDKYGTVLCTSDRSIIQMNAQPNAPIVAISERTSTHVKLEWRPAASYDELTVIGYKIFVNNRFAAILRPDQLTYTLTNGTPCNIYTVNVQALSNEKNIVSPMSRTIQFSWPGIKPGAFQRIDDKQTGTIIVAWEHPQLEDETDKLLGFKLFSKNITTHAIRLHGKYDADSHQATIFDLNNGKYLLWLEIQSENYCVRTRPIKIITDRPNCLLKRRIPDDFAKCYWKERQQRFCSPAASIIIPPLRHNQYS